MRYRIRHPREPAQAGRTGTAVHRLLVDLVAPTGPIFACGHGARANDQCRSRFGYD